MIKAQISIPETMHRQLTQLARQRHEPFTHVVRGFIELGLETAQVEGDAGIKMLERVAKLKFKGGPRDLSTNLDHYIYGGPKKLP